MLAIIDYKYILSSQHEELEKIKKAAGSFIAICKDSKPRLSKLNFIKEINNHLVSQFLYTQGILVTLEKDYKEFEGRDLSESIQLLGNQINVNILILSKTAFLIQEKAVDEQTFLSDSVLLSSSTIKNLYSILRILKRANLKTSHPTSQLAKDLAATSLNSLEKKIYGR